MSDPTTAAVADPQSADEPEVTLVPRDSVDDPAQTGGESTPDDAGASDGSAPELPKWAHQLTDDLKGVEAVTRHEKLNDLVREYADMATKADRLIELPGDDADDETREAFLSRLRPETPDAYEFENIELPEGLVYSSENDKKFRELAHREGLTNAQAAALRRYDLERTIEEHTARESAHREEINELRKEWGDSFDGNLKQAQQAYKAISEQVGDPDLGKRMIEAGYGNNADMLRTFYGIWQMIKPDTIVDGSVDGGPAADDIAADWYPATDFDS